MENKPTQTYNPFKIRTIADQRFLMSMTIVSLMLTVTLTGVFYVMYIFEVTGEPPDPLGGELSGGGNFSLVPEHPPWDVLGNDKLTFVLVGYDDVDEYAHRSDTLMIGAVDFVAKEIRVLSIPRDTLIHVPRRGFMKVNAAYALGDEDLVRKTVEEFIGVEMDYVVSVNYRGFVEVVDALGGVEIDVEHAMDYDDRRGDVHIHIEKGLQQMDGETALDYARFRHDARGDLGRIDRQQKLIKALIEQGIKPSNIVRFDDVVNALIENINITVNEESSREPQELKFIETASLIGFIKGLEDDEIKFYTLPVDDIMWEGLACLIPLYTRTNQMLSEVFEDDAEVGWDNAEIVIGPHHGIENPETAMSAVEEEDIK